MLARRLRGADVGNAVTERGQRLIGGLSHLDELRCELGIDFGDIEAVLTIDERTHLLDTVFVAFSVAAEGQEVDLELRYRLTSANEPVQLPAP